MAQSVSASESNLGDCVGVFPVCGLLGGSGKTLLSNVGGNLPSSVFSLNYYLLAEGETSYEIPESGLDSI